MKSKIVVGVAWLCFCAVLAYGMGMYRNGSGSIAAHTSLTGNHRDSSTVYMVPGMEHYKSVTVRIIIGASVGWVGTHVPASNSDTGMIRLVTYMGGKRFLLDSMSAKALIPCSLTVSHAGTTAGSDTLLKQVLAFEYMVADTLSDTVINYTYPYTWEILAKE